METEKTILEKDRDASIATSFFFFIPFVTFVPLSRPLPVVFQIGGHIAGPTSPPHYGTCHHFYRESNSAFSSLVDSRRIYLPTLLGARSSSFFFACMQMKSNLITVGIELKDQRY